jgi:hypothetical protein
MMQVDEPGQLSRVAMEGKTDRLIISASWTQLRLEEVTPDIPMDTSSTRTIGAKVSILTLAARAREPRRIST